MSTTRESSHVSRRTVTHGGGPISGHSQKNNLENNLDALLEDLQTSVTPKTNSLSRSVRARSPQMEYRSAANSTKILSEDSRAISPTRSEHRSLEKYVSTVPAGMASGIPGLEDLDKELQDVQPGQSKTVAYKEVTYHYNKDLNGQPMESSWKLEDLDKIAQTKSGPALLDEYHDSTFEESRSRRDRSPEFGKRTHKEVHYSDSMTRTGSRQASPLPGSRHKEVYHHETSYRSDPRERTIPTTLLNSSTSQEIITNRELITPPPVPANLAPGPNTKVTTTVKTYTYELPGSPENYLSSSSLSKAGDKTISYTIPGDLSEKTVTYQVEKINEKRSGSPVRYITTTPEVSTKSVHKEAKYYREERGFRTESPVTHYVATPSYEHRSTLTRNERFADINGYGPKGPGDFADHSEKSTIIYQNQVPKVNESHSTTIDRVEERYTNRNPPPTNYYCTAPPNTTTTTVYEKYENTYKSPESEVHIVKPYPAGGVKVYPSRPTNGEGPPKKFEDLMASFSDTEREVLQDIEKREKTVTKSSMTKKEVDFVDSPDKEIKASPVYYPPGYELTRKEESSAVQEGGDGWAKSKAKYEYEASAKEKSKKRSRKAVVPVCLPLCCALPCTIM